VLAVISVTISIGIISVIRARLFLRVVYLGCYRNNPAKPSIILAKIRRHHIRVDGATRVIIVIRAIR
jgi:hypothetical protein